MFQSAQVLPANKPPKNTLYSKNVTLDIYFNYISIDNMTFEIQACIFREEDQGYFAAFSAFPGIHGYGTSPDAASDDLLERFFGGLDDIHTCTEDSLKWQECQPFSLQVTPFFHN